MNPMTSDERDSGHDIHNSGYLPSLSPSPSAGLETPLSPQDTGRPPRPPGMSTEYSRRNVSWGLQPGRSVRGVPTIVQRGRSDMSNLTQTPSFTTNTDGSHSLGIHLPYRGDRHSHRYVMELPNDHGIVNPMETEAETYLLRAIEHAGAEADAQANIMNNIPHKVIESMQRRQAIIEERPVGTLQRSTSSSMTTVPINNMMMSSRRKSTHNLAIPRPEALTSSSRQATLDDTLSNLTQAMDAIHAESEPPLPRPKIQRLRTVSYGARVRSNTIDSSHGTRNPMVVPEGNEDEEEVGFSSAAAKGSVSLNATQTSQWATPTSIPTVGSGGLIHRQTATKTSESEDGDLNMVEIEEGQLRDPDDDNDKKLKKDTQLPSESSLKGENVISASERRRSRWGRTSSLMLGWGVTGGLRNFIRPKKKIIRWFFCILMVYIAIPSLGAAAILFYLFDNPPTGILSNGGKPIHGKLFNTHGDEVDPNRASISYFLLFAGARQAVTVGMGLVTQLFLIDYLAIDRGFLFKLGSRLPLFVLQAKGWPFVLFFWSIYDWALTAGTHPFFSHWMHFQNWVSLFNESNPDGNLSYSTWNHRVLGLATGISLAVAIKRFWIAIFLGRQTYYRYSDQLAILLSKMLLISEVAALSGQAARNKRDTNAARSFTGDEMGELMNDAYDDESRAASADHGDSLGVTAMTGLDATKQIIVVDPDDCNPYTGRLSGVQRNRITRLLGAWEEPNQDMMNTEAMSVESLMRFRRAMTHLRNELPFSSSFGPAGTREDCVISSQEVFSLLLNMSDSETLLNFEVIALLGAKNDGTLDQDKLIDLIKLFRPDRDGTLSMVHFVRSVDTVYKEVRMLRASVHNSSKVDGQFETIFNFFFYLIIAVIVLNVLGLDPFAIFVSVSGLILGFAFMIGTASSKYFEGLLFILVRRPYGIGDCIHISDPNKETTKTGSPFWLVEDINLFSTQVRMGLTNERASLSNGSLANSRIINSSKSTNAGVHHMLKFPLDVPYEKVKIFHEALETFIRNRPREWIGLRAFRATSVNAQLGFIEYMVLVDHRETWAALGQVRGSQSDLMGFGVELAKKLDIVYQQPTLPIQMNLEPQQQQQTQEMMNRMMPGNPPLMPYMMGVEEAAAAAGFGETLPSSDFQQLAEKFPPRNPSVSKID